MERQNGKTIIGKIIKYNEKKIYQTAYNNYDGNRCVADICSDCLD